MNKVKQVTRRDTPYEGSDTFMEWHKEKTKSSMDEASKGADYATPIWRCENDWDRTKAYLGWGAMWSFFLGSLYVLASCFEELVG